MPPRVSTTVSANIPEDMADQQVLSYRQIEALLGVCEDSIRRAVQRKELKLTRLGPRRVGVRKSELRRWLDHCTA